MELDEMYRLYELNQSETLDVEERKIQRRLQYIIHDCEDPIIKKAMILRFDVPKGSRVPYWFQVGMIIGTNGDAVRVAVTRYLKGLDNAEEL